MAGLVVAAQLCAQDGVTKIGPHTLGESFEEWRAANQIDMSAICGSKKRNDKTMCSTLTFYKGGGVGNFSLRRTVRVRSLGPLIPATLFRLKRKQLHQI